MMSMFPLVTFGRLARSASANVWCQGCSTDMTSIVYFTMATVYAPHRTDSRPHWQMYSSTLAGTPLALGENPVCSCRLDIVWS